MCIATVTEKAIARRKRFSERRTFANFKLCLTTLVDVCVCWCAVYIYFLGSQECAGNDQIHTIKLHE